MFAATACGILACMVLAMARALMGPTVYDRIMAVNAFGTKTVLIIAVLKFIRSGDMGWPRNVPDEPDDL